MKKTLILLFVLITTLPALDSFAQFDRPQVQVGIGVSEPYNELKGTYYANEMLRNFDVLTISPDFMTNNYGGKTGLDFFVKGKINFDKHSIVRGVAHFNFNTFNTFESSKSGNIGVQVVNINNQLDTVISSITYNYTFNNFAFGLGLEVAPTSFTKVVSPYFGANLNFNFMSGELSRTENRYDSVSAKFNDFRIGVNFDAGIEAKVSSTIGLALGIKYDLGNLLLKNTNSGVADAVEWGKSNGALNDDEGRFYSSLYGPVITSVRRQVQGKEKKINWGTIYLGVNISLNEPEKKKKPGTVKPK